MTVNGAKGLQHTKPTLFQPAVIRSVADEPQGALTFNLTDAEVISDTAIDSTSSFKYSVGGMGLRSTQQLNIDWSDFANHTFFNSAQVKVNVAFDRIQNQFPFDGTNKEVESFMDSLTGFEKWAYDGYPKYKGYLFFSGTNGETFGGTYVTVKDQAGSAYPLVSKKFDGVTVINPKTDSMTLEYWIYVPTQNNDNQIIVDKHSGSMGFMVTLDSLASTTAASSSFRLISGSATSTVQINVPKGTWNHVAWVWNRTPGIFNVNAYLNAVLVKSGTMPVEFGEFSATGDMYIGSGSSLTSVFTPANTFSGALDELRIWHEVRQLDQIKESLAKNVFASGALKLYYKFNEASGSGSPLVIDASSNSLHANLSAGGVALGVRQFPTASSAGADPMTYESVEFSPILFPTQPDVMDYRLDLLVSASNYDNTNPNIITRLIPKHYLLEGQVEDGLSTEEGEILDSLQTGVDPRSTKLGATQVLLLMLYTWAKFFDEMKLYTQAFADIGFVDYDDTDTVPDQFLQQLARNQGIELPPLFTGASIGQFLNANNIQGDTSTNALTLQYIQNQIWRRILINLRDVVTSKGTIHGVKSFIRATGIDPDNNFRIREYGGPSKQNLGFVRDSRSEISTMLNFVSGGLIISPFLSGARTEPGYPLVSANVSGSDGLFTSGSWTFEGTYKFPIDRPYAISQSLARLMTTGSTQNASGGLVANIVAVSGSEIVNFFARPMMASNGPIMTLTVTGVNIFDGDKWYVSIGKQRNDDNLSSDLSSSYFLRVAKQNYGEIIESISTSSFFNDYSGSGQPAWNFKSATDNASGSFIVIGSASINTTPSVFLNSTSDASIVTRATNFQGRVSQLRFWSKYLTETEWPEHVRDFRSVGVQEPLLNFNFVTNKSGSFERLRIDASTDQQVTQSSAVGTIDIFDFSQNNLHLSGTFFSGSSNVVQPERYFYSYISPKFDEGSTTNKVRIRSFKDFANVQATPWAQVAPVYEIPKFEEPTDSTKFTIDYSIVDYLDQDIITIFSTLDALDNVIGNPELAFSPDYPGLENLRNVYFNKLTDKVNLKSFFEFYKWFDTNIGSFVQQLIPRKTKFLGTNFVIESHMLERPKLEYLFTDIYLGDSSRDSLKDTILLQLFVGEFSRY